MNPEISSNSRINLLGVSVPNPGNRLKAGMARHVFIGNGEHNNMLSLPIDAVIGTVKEPQFGYRQQRTPIKSNMVEAGMEACNRVEIKIRLKSSRYCIDRGPYLINSEFNFQNGANPMDGMKM